MAAAGLGTMRNVATQPAQTVMRADGRSWWTQKIASHQVPCLPRQMPLDVAKCHACHAKRRPARTSASQEPPQPQVPLLPRKRTADLTKCHACHAKCLWMSPSATPATQKRRPARTSASQEPPQPQVPRLPRKRKVYLTKCHGVCAKDHGITGDQRGPSASQEPAQCHKCPDLTKCDNGSMSRSATPATPSAAATTASIGNQVRHQSQPSAINATRATPATPKMEISPGKPGCKKAVYSSLSCWRPGRSWKLFCFFGWVWSVF